MEVASFETDDHDETKALMQVVLQALEEELRTRQRVVRTFRDAMTDDKLMDSVRLVIPVLAQKLRIETLGGPQSTNVDFVGAVQMILEGDFPGAVRLGRIADLLAARHGIRATEKAVKRLLLSDPGKYEHRGLGWWRYVGQPGKVPAGPSVDAKEVASV